MRAVARAICFAAVLCAAPQAFAAMPEQRSVVLRIDDVDLNSAHGARTMLRRIERAVSVVCDVRFARQYPAARRAYRICRRETMTNVVDRLNAPHLEHALAERLAERP